MRTGKLLKEETPPEIKKNIYMATKCRLFPEDVRLIPSLTLPPTCQLVRVLSRSHGGFEEVVESPWSRVGRSLPG